MEFTPIHKFDNGGNWDMEHYRFGSQPDEDKLKNEIFNNSNNDFLEQIITKMARHDFMCLRDDAMKPIADCMIKDYRQIFIDFVRFDPENATHDEHDLDDVKRKEWNKSIVESRLASYVSIPSSHEYRGKRDPGTYAFEAICRSLAVLMPGILAHDPKMTFEKLMPSLCSGLQTSVHTLKLLFKIDNLGGISSFYAPEEEDVDANLSSNDEKLNEFYEYLKNMMISTGIVPDDRGNQIIFQTELDSTDSVDLCVRNRARNNSDDMISKNSFKAIPTNFNSRLFIETRARRCKNRNLNHEYFDKATGKPYNERIIYFQIEVDFKFNQTVQSTKRLLIPPSKSYKIYDKNSVTNMLNTIKTLIDYPGKMTIDVEKGINGSDYNSSLIFRNSEFSRSTTEKDIKNCINEHLRKAYSKMDGHSFIDFLEKMTDCEEGRAGYLSDYNHGGHLSGFGISYLQKDFSSLVPDKAEAFIQNLRDIRKLMADLSKESEEIEEFLTKKFEELKIDIKSKISPRDLMIKIITDDVKTDPLSLIGKGGYLAEIAKEFM